MEDAKALLAQQLHNFKDLEQLLEQEKQFLVEQNITDLNEALGKKSRLLTDIEQLDKALENAVKADDALLPPSMVEQIKTSLQSCQEMAAVNASITQKSQIRTQTLLSQIHKIKGKNSLTYDSLGKTSISRSQRITKA